MSSLINAAQETVPFTQPYSNPSRAHPGWNDFVKSFQSEALDWHSIWISSGRPQSGFVCDMRRSSRKAYHKQVDFVLKRESKIKGVKIAESFLKSDSRDFWKECDKLRGRKTCPITTVEGFTDSDDIADAFSNHYNELYNSVDYDEDGMNILYNEVNDSICQCSGNHSHSINSSNIKDAINKLKRGKNDGYDGLTSDYIINGTPLLFHYLSILFSLMLSHCYAPSSFCISTMVPIPKKSSGSMGEITNYRGIALSSLMSKIFDNCIISNQYDSLFTNDLQFAYKAKTSTIHCVSSIFETANYYVSSAGAAHVCMLDASKAFDRVNLLTLFRKLHNRSMCPLFLRFLIHSYCNQKMRVKWNGSLSGTFSASNGVKQGGVLSPLLFTVYLDQLILALKESGIGCHLNGMFVGAFIYADDVTLLAPTSMALKAMLSICTDFAASHNLLFNASKTKCMYFNDAGSQLQNTAKFMGRPIEYVDCTDILGVSVTSRIKERNVNSSVQKFYCRVNSVLYDFKDIPCDVKAKLLDSYCLDVYGSQLWNYSKHDVDMFLLHGGNLFDGFGKFQTPHTVIFYHLSIHQFQ